jgi:hypothetical protein
LLEEVLERANWNISVNIPLKLSETIVKKCKESGCWLFIYTDDKILKIV